MLMYKDEPTGPLNELSVHCICCRTGLVTDDKQQMKWLDFGGLCMSAQLPLWKGNGFLQCMRWCVNLQMRMCKKQGLYLSSSLQQHGISMITRTQHKWTQWHTLNVYTSDNILAILRWSAFSWWNNSFVEALYILLMISVQVVHFISPVWCA